SLQRQLVPTHLVRVSAELSAYSSTSSIPNNNALTQRRGARHESTSVFRRDHGLLCGRPGVINRFAEGALAKSHTTRSRGLAGRLHHSATGCALHLAR